jgi:phospholipid/cholesterol/gamma-HCH transport system permease protein
MMMFRFLIEKPLAFLAKVGQATLLLNSSLGWLFMGRVRQAESLRQASRVGVESIPMVFILATIGGGVLSLQLCNTLGTSGGDAYIGYLVGTAILREIAPIFTALALAARSGTAIASELAQMKVSSQIDAITVLQVSPTRYLVLPRLLACTTMMPLLGIFAGLIGIISGMVVAKLQLGMTFSYYINSIYTLLDLRDIYQLLIKSVVFGLLLGIISASLGIETKGGSQDVGLAAMKTAVWVSVTVLLADLAITWCFKAFSPMAGVSQ